MGKRAILIAGPTASGKSTLAIKLAQECGGLIINTDSMQVYSVLDVLSARPQQDELSQAEHRLYGIVEPDFRYSTGEWLRDVVDVMGSSIAAGRDLIFVGGTGLYFQALLEGLAEVPPVAPELVRQIEQEVSSLDRRQRLELLRVSDPEMAKRLVEPDRQRLVRALSVLRGTGRSLVHWQKTGTGDVLRDYVMSKIVVCPERDVLRARIARRFALMWEHGAVEEVQQLLAWELDPSLPVMKAIGVREIGDWLAGKSKKEEAISLAVVASQQYAKRQKTWFRKRMADWNWQE